MKISISLDDGHISDLKAGRLLQKYGLKGTFYISSASVPKTTQMTLKEVKQLVDMGHELGGHTVSHYPDMKLIEKDSDLKFEIENNKALLEHIFKIPVTKFCYPRGRHDERVRKAVKDAGFKEARTTRVLQIMNDTGDPLQTPTTIHMFQRDEYDGVHWLDMAKTLFKVAVQQDEDGVDGVFFSFWAHSKELDQQNDWDNFDEMLELLSNYKNI